MDKVKEQVEKQIQTITETGVATNNIDYLYKLIDICVYKFTLINRCKYNISVLNKIFCTFFLSVTIELTELLKN